MTTRTLRHIKLLVAAALALSISSPILAATDPAKVLRTTFEAQDAGFDTGTANLYSGTIMEAIGESLLTYDYMARPAKLVPQAVTAMPTVTDEGRTYTFHIIKGIYFAPDPAFKGKKRELTAEDYIYSFKRIMDPKLRSQWRFIFEGKIVGLDAMSKKAEASGHFDYDTPVEGLKAIDRYTLQVRLNTTDFNFLYTMAMPSTMALAREVVEAYKDDLGAHPVGTNAYMLKEYQRGHRIVLEANPHYRGFKWTFAAGTDREDKGIVAEMSGKQMPRIGRVEINVIEEEQSKYLSFVKGESDYVARVGNIAESWQDGDDVKPELKKLGITRQDTIEAEITYYLINFKDKVTGGSSKEKIALRRAIIMSYDMATEARVVRKNLVVHNAMPIPRGVVGYDPNYRGVNSYNPDAANKLLDKFGYKRGADGWRTNPDGSPLELVLASEPQQVQAEYDKLWNKGLEKIGIRLKVRKQNFADNLKAAKDCQLQMWGSAWNADYPDGENFLQLLYGPNSGQSNNGCYNSPVFNKLYEMAAKLPDSPKRDRLYELMSRQMEYDGAWKIGISRIRSTLIQPGIQGHKRHPVLLAEWKYMDIDPALRNAAATGKKE